MVILRGEQARLERQSCASRKALSDFRWNVASAIEPVVDAARLQTHAPRKRRHIALVVRVDVLHEHRIHGRHSTISRGCCQDIFIQIGDCLTFYALYRMQAMSRHEFSQMIKAAQEHLQVGVEEFAELLGVDDQTVYKWKNEERGTYMHRIDKIKDRLRELGVPARIIDQDHTQSAKVSEPLTPYPIGKRVPILNHVKCSFKDLWSADDQEFLPGMADEWTAHPGITDKNAFALIATGDSMVDAGIEEGDYVIISPNSFPRTGERALILFKKTQEATIKKVEFKDGGRLALLISEHKKAETKLITVDETVKFYLVYSVIKLQRKRRRSVRR